MRTGGPSQGTQRIDQRAGVSRALVFAAATTAPHASTTRATYTVPAGAKALVEQANLASVVDAAVTTAGVALVRARVTPDSGGAHAVGTLVAPTALVVGTGDSRTEPMGILLNAGNVVDLFTEDAATGGTRRYEASIDLLEFTP